MAPEKVIYTIGSSRRTEEEFIEILKAYDIDTLVDVRSFPKSKFEHFSKDNLSKSLEEGEIRYEYLGRELGGFRKGGYELYAKTEDFDKGIKKLEGIASKGKTVFMCAERFPWKCHRRYISKALSLRGWKVIHIIEKDRVWVPGERGTKKDLHSSENHNVKLRGAKKRQISSHPSLVVCYALLFPVF